MDDRERWTRLFADTDASGSAQPERICELAVASLGITGAGLSMATENGIREVVSSTDEVAARIEELQLTLGEGPCIDAVRTGGPILVPDIDQPQDVVVERWPTFLTAAAEAGVRAIFAFPLRIGAIGLGAMDMYRELPGPLTTDQLTGALLAADAAALSLLYLAGGTADSGGPSDGLLYHPQVHQATGMVEVQLGVSIEEAYLILRARAFASGRPLLDVAVDIVERRIRFTEEES
jgi:hypothetical protein